MMPGHTFYIYIHIFILVAACTPIEFCDANTYVKNLQTLVNLLQDLLNKIQHITHMHQRATLCEKMCKKYEKIRFKIKTQETLEMLMHFDLKLCCCNNVEASETATKKIFGNQASALSFLLFCNIGTFLFLLLLLLPHRVRHGV